MSKKCGMCELFLPLSVFYKDNRSSDGLTYICKTCVFIYQHSHDVKLRTMYNAQYSPDYTAGEWCKWALYNGYTELHSAWVNSGYIATLAPSGDRIDSNLPYTLGNLELTTWEINNQRGHVDRKRPVILRRLDGMWISEYPSVTAVAEDLNVLPSNISACCTGRLNSVSGYITHYADTPYVHDTTSQCVSNSKK
jgi:hypothetical protein